MEGLNKKRKEYNPGAKAEHAKRHTISGAYAIDTHHNRVAQINTRLHSAGHLLDLMYANCTISPFRAWQKEGLVGIQDSKQKNYKRKKETLTASALSSNKTPSLKGAAGR
ncbi:hypothetical protein L1049_004759 [Liquidambar formosana]|uniref:Uncharacterized protein n=1 Tax=Liquidambar formosana TaxID=63359 RepID=A0AAP0RPI9_LIQFO